MKVVTLLPADIYQVVNKSLLNDTDKLVLNMLYMPIIGSKAITLYNTLYNELKANGYVSEELTHHHLMTNLSENLSSLKEARIKLEGIGLLKTYYMEGSINSYVYELYSPITAHEFFNHPIFNMVFYNNVGKEEYLRIKSYFKVPKIDLSDYEDITSPFDMTFNSKSYTAFEMENRDEIVNKNTRGLEYESIFDFDAFLSSMPKNVMNEKALTKSVRDLITNLAFLYKLDPFTMADVAKVCLNEKGLIDKEELKNKARKYYEFNNDGRLPSLIFKNQPNHLRSAYGDNSYIGKLINVFETTNPYDFLKNKYKGVRPTERDMKILEMLIVELKLNPAVVNVLIDYVLKTQNNRLVKAYVETIAGEWKRKGIETAKEAMEHAEKAHKKLAHVKEERKISLPKTEVTPEWFNKQHEKKEMTKEDKEEIESFLREYV